MFRLQESEFLQWLFNRISNHTSCVLIHSASLRACSERAMSWVKHMKHPESLVFLQDDVVMGTLTVREDLRFQQLYGSWSQSVREKKMRRLRDSFRSWDEQSGRFTGNKPNTPSSDWLHVQSPPANNNPLLFVHEILVIIRRSFIARYVKTYESTIVLPQKRCWATGMIMKGLI